jgi:cytochrome c-type biogenesis protein CcmH/NrfG
MEAGLVAYRSGEFAAAIDIWQQVLEFNPQHQAAKDSIQTTERQLVNLKALDSKE